ncbi:MULTISPECIES: SHOCT domain-containing protein [Mameliella]|uniref:SHOCT domain-containing protein n=1 Tax=Mameliella TaxID=1434019 RepID=UPI001E29360A|nr:MULTISPECIES: hypothetical protein [Mameliella]
MARADADGSWGAHMWGGGFGFMGGLTMLIFWGAVVALIVFLVVRLRDAPVQPRETKALDALQLRFAKGEIDEEEYRRLKAALEE